MDKTNEAPCRQPGVDPDWFFAPDGAEETMSNSELVSWIVEHWLIAKVRYCDGCPLAAQCLEWGWYEEWGVWGGYDPTERAAMRQGESIRTVKVPPKPSPRREAVVSLVKDGLGVDEAAEQLGTSPTQVRWHLGHHLALQHRANQMEDAQTA